MRQALLYSRGVDEDLQRLEAVLGRQPDHRALPDVDQLLAEAGVDASLLDEDDRARKLLADAIITRPFGDLADVRAVATEVELLVLEVRQLAATLEAGGPMSGVLEDRLMWARKRLTELRELL